MAATPLLGLSLPLDGATNWGALVNTGITALIDSAVAGTTTLTTDADVVLTTTVEASNQARQAILLCTGARTAERTIIAPSQSKTYFVINATTGGFGVKIAGSGPTTGIVIPAGKVFIVAWNGSDFATISPQVVNLGTTDVTGTLPFNHGGTGQTTYTDGQLLIGNSATNGLNKANLTAGTGIAIANSAGGISITNSLPDQTVTLTGAGSTTISGSYPNFTISSSSSGGTVTGVTATSPVASSGGTAPVISLSTNYGDTQNPYASKTANHVLAAPTGIAGAPTFRALVAADIPTLNQNTTGTAGGLSATLVVGSGGTGQTSYTDGQLLIGNTSGNTLTKSTLTAGAGVAIVNGNGSITISATGSGGTVTGVTATSPVASSGGTAPVISLSTGYGDTQNPYASKTTNTFLAAPNGSSGAPSFRAIVAADIPTLNQNTTGTALNVTGTVAIGNGGTGQTTAVAAFNALSPITTNGDLIIGNGANSATRLGIGGNGQVLQSNGTTATWQTLPTGSGTVTSVGLSLPVQFSITTSTVTTSGTLTAVWQNQSAGFFLAGPVTGGAATPAFRQIAASDIPTLNQNTTGTASNVTGTVAVSNGGTGGTTQSTARTGIGATTVGSNFFTLVNPSAITFPQINADNTVSALTATSFRSAIGAGNGDVTLTGTQTLTNKTLTKPTINDGYTEQITALGTVTLSDLTLVNRGSIQTVTLNANSTPTDSLLNGQSLTLMVDDGAGKTITWPSVVWKTNEGAAPTLNTAGYTVIQLWKVASTLYGARVGNA